MGGTQNAAPTPKIRVFPPKKITAPPPRGPKGPPPTAPLSPPPARAAGFLWQPSPPAARNKAATQREQRGLSAPPGSGGGCGGGQRHVLGPFVAFSGPSVALSAPRGRSGARRHAGHVPARRGEGRGEAAPKKRPFGGRKIRELAGSPENGVKSMETGQKKKKGTYGGIRRRGWGRTHRDGLGGLRGAPAAGRNGRKKEDLGFF